MARRKHPNDPTPKERAAVMAYIETGSMTKAYKLSHDTKSKGPALNATAKKLFRRPAVRLLLASLQEKQQKRHEVTMDRVVQELAKIGFSNMMDYITIDENGSAHCDLSTLTRDQAAAIHEASFETVMSNDPDALEAAGEDADGEGKKRVAVLKGKIKLADKKAALETLLKHLGGFEKDNRQKGEAAGDAMAKGLTDIEQARRIAFAMQRAMARKQAAAKAPKANAT